MTFAEASDYIKGQDRRSRQEWEMTRVLARLIHKVETGKNLKMELPWDDEVEDEEKESRPTATKEELETLNAKANEIAKMMNNERTVRDTIQDDGRP